MTAGARRVAYIVACMLVVPACERLERPLYHFATLSEAETQGEVRRGWVPRIIPAGAEDVTLSYDIDTNETWLRLRLDAIQFAQLRERLTVSDVTELPRAPRGGAEWWPSELLRTSERKAPGVGNWTFADCGSSPGCDAAELKGRFAMDPVGGMVFFWRT